MSTCGDKPAGSEAVKSEEEQCQEQSCSKGGPTGPGSGDPCSDPDFAGGDQQERYRELCRRTTECKAYFKKLEECNQRVNSRTKTEEKCVEEVIDYFHCVDHCAAKRFFKLLK